ncbi:MAG TPA: helix-turn-helix transcriptional regulator [Ktedonobacteraceae bacterium]|nr:helix-turn-helix transcriptional regulator [Ktedonobacteraceae bacterium]
METAEKGKPNLFLREQRLQRGWSLQHVVDELHALCAEDQRVPGVTVDMVSKWEHGKKKPSPFYQEKLCRLYGLSATQLGFVNGQDVAGIGGPPPSHLKKHGTIEEVSSDQPLLQYHTLATQELESQDMNKSRREFIQRTSGAIGTALFVPSYELLISSLVDRLTMALARPSSLDETMLTYLEQRTARYWRDRNDSILASYDLLSYVLEDLQKVTRLLEGSLLPKVRSYLCSIAGEIAMLVGELFFDMSDYRDARSFHALAIRAAQEANNEVLQAVAWGRKSFAWTYGGNAPAALLCIQEARHLAEQNSNTTVKAWLAAVEAEIRANLYDLESCRVALDGAECVQDRKYAEEDCYWIHFDRSLLAGYRGICFLRLHDPKDARRAFLLKEAQQSLEEALALLDPVLMRRRPNLLTDLAGTYIRQGEIEVACDYTLQAVTLIAQIKSPVVFQRLVTLRRDLDQWENTPQVQNLDEHLTPLLSQGWYRSNI